MASKRSKKRRSSKEDYPLKEESKVEEGVFDKRAMMKMKKLFTHNIVTNLEFIIAKGKEADVYIARSGSAVPDPFVVVKIFRVETSNFGKRIDYINGDPRFGRIKSDIYSLVCEWCKKEYGNLKLAEVAGIHAPKPYLFNGNVLAIEFLGDSDGKPSQTLRAAGTENPEETLNVIIEDIKKLYARDLVHADLSEYNILMKEGIPYIIDFGQAVVLGHPMANEFLKRDIRVILTYFKKNYGIGKDEEETTKYITSK
jgi:RIO kinase 1